MATIRAVPVARRADGGAEAPAAGDGLRPGAAARPAAVPARDDVAVLVLAAFAPGSRLWGLSRLVLGPRVHRGTPGLRFAKVLGSGHEGGFGLRPGLDRQGLFLVFDGAAAADAFVAASPALAAYRVHSRELVVARLRAFASRGRWDGQPIAASAAPPAAGPVAALTRASVRAHKAWAFWRMAPPAQRAVEHAPGCRLAVGLGEAPLLRQATFSLWDDAAAMDAYARRGAHQQAIAASVRGGHLGETMFVRFVPLSIEGVWKGRALG